MIKKQCSLKAVITLSVLIILIICLLPAVSGEEEQATVTFHSNGELYSTQTVTIGETLKAPTVPNLPERMVSFVGWSTEENGLENLYDFSAPVTSDFALYAQFSDKYLISFKDADGEIYYTELIAADDFASPPGTLPDNPGSLFLYWTIGTSDEIYEFNIPVNNNIILTPRYGDAHYVAFNSMKGTAVEGQSIKNGETATEPAAPTRYGYVFSYWSTVQNTDPDDQTTAFHFSEPVTESVTLYAVWKPDTNEDNMPEVKVIVWKEKEGLPLQFDKTNSSNYVYHASYDIKAIAGTTVNPADNNVSENDAAPPYSEYYRCIPVVAEGDGFTVVNVYYTSIIYKINFNLNNSNAFMNITENGNTVRYNNYTSMYSIQVKINMNLEDIWPVSDNGKFEIESGGQLFYGWAPPQNLNNLSGSGTSITLWSTKRFNCTFDMLPDENYGSNEYTVNGYWLDTNQAKELYLNYMFEALPEEPQNPGELGTDYVVYNGVNYIHDAEYSQKAVTQNASYSYKEIEGKQAVTDRAMIFNEYSGQLENVTSVASGQTQFLLYNRNQYNLKLDAAYGNQSSSIENIPSGRALKYVSISEPVRNGYDFSGWYEDAEYNKPFDFENSTMPSRNLTLFARWESAELTATFYDSEGGNVLGTQGVANGNAVKVPTANDPYYLEEGKGYEGLGIFKGWYYTRPSSLIVPFNFSEEIHDNVSIYGLYQTSGFKITYDDAGGTGTVPTDSETYKLNVWAHIQDADLTKNGSDFIGWQERDTAGIIHYPDSYIKMYDDINFEAVYTDIGLVTNLTYSANYGDTPETITDGVISGSRAVLRSNLAFTRDGYNLIGWAENSAATAPDYQCGEMYTVPGGGMTLYAVWEPLPGPFKVTYDSTGGEGELPSDNTEYAYNDTVTVMSNETLHNTGNKFLCWNTESDGSGTVYAPGQTFRIQKDTTLYAQWSSQPNPLYLTYDLNDGEGTVPDDGTARLYDEEITVKSNETIYKQGFKFENWNIKSDGSGSNYAVGDTFRIIENMTLYAQWAVVSDTFTVTYNSNGGETAVPVDDTEYEFDQSVTVLSNETVHYPGFKFESWNTESDGSGSSYAVGGTFLIENNTTLYAQWTDMSGNSYSVTYDENGGEGTVPADDTAYKYDELVTVKSNETIHKQGNLFAGWNAESGGGGSNYAVGDTFRIIENTELYAQWTGVSGTFTVTYNSNGGETAVPADENAYEFKEEVTVLSNETVHYPGFKFESWNTESDGSGSSYAVGGTFLIENNTTLYAQWTDMSGNSYSVTYDENGGEGTVPADDTAYKYDELVTVKSNETIHKQGNLFAGWNAESGGSGSNYAVGDTFRIIENTELYAQWADVSDTFTVTYNSNGGETAVPADDTEYEFDQSVTVLSNETVHYPGFKFESWNTAADGSGGSYAVGGTFLIENNTTLYAQWTDMSGNSYSVTYDENGGEGTVPADDTAYIYDELVTVKSNETIHKQGNSFAGWNTESGGSGSNYAVGDTFRIIENTELYAQWADVSDTFTVTYNSNGGETAVPADDTEYEFDQSVTVLSNETVHYPGFKFESWNTESDGSGSSYAVGSTFLIENDTTLYAQWTDMSGNSYSVTYDENGGEGTVPADDTTYKYDELVTVKSNETIHKQGNLFAGWNAESGGSGSNYAVGDTFRIIENTELYAQWTGVSGTFTVTYDSNGGETAVPADEKAYEFKEEVTVLSNETVHYPGFKFESWNTAADGGGSSYAVGDTFLIENDTVLYAQWTDMSSNSYSVTYDENGGEGTVPADDTAYKYDELVTVKSNETIHKQGNLFAGWNAESGGDGSNYAVGDTFRIIENTELYAQWTGVSGTFTVTYDSNGGEEAVPADEKAYEFKEEVTVLSNETVHYSGFKFESWNTAADGSGSSYAVGDTFLIENNTTLYAQWTDMSSNSYSVTYDENGGEGTVPADDTAYKYDELVTVKSNETIHKQGNLFAGWNAESGGSGSNYAVGDTFRIIENTELYAQWTGVSGTFTVTYDSNGGETAVPADENAYEFKEEVTVLSNETVHYSGFKFESWNTESDGSGSSYVVGGTFLIENDTVLYAQWTDMSGNSYSVTYDENGGEGTIPADDTAYKYDDLVTVKSNETIHKQGNLFAGWNTESGGGGSNYAVGDTFRIIENTELYAQWTGVSGTFTVTYDSNGGEGTVPADDKKYEYYETVKVLSDDSIYKTGYSFTGWNTESGGSGTAYSVSDTFEIEQNTVLYAQWAEESGKFRVTYNANGGTGTVPKDENEYSYHATVVVVENKNVYNSGYSFAGWNMKQDGSGKMYAGKDTFMIETNTVLYAQWAAESGTFTVTYDSNGGEKTVPADNTKYKYNAVVTVRSNETVHYPGYSFSGWNMKQDGSGSDMYYENDTFRITEDIVLYAQWQNESGIFKVIYDPNGGEGVIPTDDADYKYDSLVTVLSGKTIRYVEHLFKNWNTKADGTRESYDENDTFRITENMTLHAQWENESKPHEGGNGTGNATVKNNTNENPPDIPPENLSPGSENSGGGGSGDKTNVSVSPIIFFVPLAISVFAFYIKRDEDEEKY